MRSIQHKFGSLKQNMLGKRRILGHNEEAKDFLNPCSATAQTKENPIANSKRTLQVKKLKRLIAQSLDDDKAEDIVTIDLAGKSTLADYMIVASGRSQKHIATLADHISDKLMELGFGRAATEGKDTSDWVVVDAGDIIVHIFHPEARRHYNLEKMWAMPELIGTLEAAL